jgi:hypothetical protein
MIPLKMLTWFSNKKVENANAKISPKYFARSAINI